MVTPVPHSTCEYERSFGLYRARRGGSGVFVSEWAKPDPGIVPVDLVGDSMRMALINVLSHERSGTPDRTVRFYGEISCTDVKLRIAAQNQDIEAIRNLAEPSPDRGISPSDTISEIVLTATVEQVAFEVRLRRDGVTEVLQLSPTPEPAKPDLFMQAAKEAMEVALAIEIGTRLH